MMIVKKMLLIVISFILGFLLVFQGRSYSNIDAIILRDSRINIFQEIKILKEKNEELKKEINSNESILESLQDQNKALQTIEDNIKRYKLLSGKFPVFGPGVTISIHGDLTTPWVIDLVNEFFNSGAEAVDINGIRITNHTIGIDTIPNGQLLMSGSILSPPYVFNIIGEPSTMIAMLETPGGIFSRLQASFPDFSVEVGTKEIIQMK